MHVWKYFNLYPKDKNRNHIFTLVLLSRVLLWFYALGILGMPFIARERISSWGKIKNWDCIAVPILFVWLGYVKILIHKISTKSIKIIDAYPKIIDAHPISSSLSPNSQGINLYFPKREILMYGFLSIWFPSLLWWMISILIVLYKGLPYFYSIKSVFCLHFHRKRGVKLSPHPLEDGNRKSTPSSEAVHPLPN